MANVHGFDKPFATLFQVRQHCLFIEFEHTHVHNNTSPLYTHIQQLETKHDLFARYYASLGGSRKCSASDGEGGGLPAALFPLCTYGARPMWGNVVMIW